MRNIEQVSMAQWLSHRLTDWQVLASRLGCGSNTERILKDKTGRCKATAPRLSHQHLTVCPLMYCLDKQLDS